MQKYAHTVATDNEDEVGDFYKEISKAIEENRTEMTCYQRF